MWINTGRIRDIQSRAWHQRMRTRSTNVNAHSCHLSPSRKHSIQRIQAPRSRNTNHPLVPSARKTCAILASQLSFGRYAPQMAHGRRRLPCTRVLLKSPEISASELYASPFSTKTKETMVPSHGKMASMWSCFTFMRKAENSCTSFDQTQ